MKERHLKPTTLRDLFLFTNIDILVLVFFLLFLSSSWNTKACAHVSEEDSTSDSTSNESLDNVNPVYAIVFPWFTQTIAIFIYYLITRYLRILPYTAIVFLLGTIIGASRRWNENVIALSADIWLGINAQVILLVFLPGLIFHDSFTINVHLFFQAFWQLILFAFPMVLGGSILTALVAGYILPYDTWSPSLCMTFGAILSGTDPIAVAGLLNASGAPQRLKMHISGESLLNDGSVVVLFNIFSAMYYYELEIPDGEQFSVGQGFGYFFQLTLGGVAIGFTFGLGTVLMLKFLNRRLSAEENVVQVVLTISSAYLAYFTSEILALCSGIMATIACGITVKVLGETFFNDQPLTLHFWQVTADLLNTLLFVLGGTLWGNILSKATFEAQDWGYLALLFVILIIIRFILVFSFFFITKRIGIGTNWKEAVFMSYGGFRGSVGIALALSLNAHVHNNDFSEISRGDTDTIFCMVGGISLFTLLINGMTSGPLLSVLGLAATEKTRKKITENYTQQMIMETLQAYVRLLSQERFRGIDHSIVKHHVPFLKDFTFDELMIAVERHKSNTPVLLYSKPRLENVLPYLLQDETEHSDSILRSQRVKSPSFEQIFKSQSYERLVASQGLKGSGTSLSERWKIPIAEQPCTDKTPVQGVDDIDEVRMNYIEILRSAYYNQIQNGSLQEFDDLTHSLFEGLDSCEDAANKGEPLCDWEATKKASDTRVVLANRLFVMVLRRFKQMWHRQRKLCTFKDIFDPTTFKTRFLVRQNLAFVRAHRHSKRVFDNQFANPESLTPAEAQVIKESQEQVRLAEADLNGIDLNNVLNVKGHLLCLILLNKSVQYVEQLSRQNLIPEIAASELLEKLDVYIEKIWTCDVVLHVGRLSTPTKITRLKQLPRNIINNFHIHAAIHEMLNQEFRLETCAPSP